MIKVNLAEIEILSATLMDSASKSEDTLQKLKFLSNEIANDIELPMYTQADAVLQAVSHATDTLNRSNDTLQSLKNVISSVSSTYQETEKANTDALNRMLSIMSSLDAGYNSIIVSQNTPLVEHDDTVMALDKVQQLVTESSEEMQITTIAAITKVIEDEYEINDIKEVNGDV